MAHSGALNARQRQWVALLAAGPGAVLAGITAARLWGLRAGNDRRVHVLVGSGRQPHRLPDGSRLHRTVALGADASALRPPRTGLVRSLVDAASWARTDDDARALLAAAYQQHLVVAGQIEAVLPGLPRARRRALIAEAAALAADGAHALTELDLVRLCSRHHIPRPQHQIRRTDATGRARYLDAYWPRWHLHVEVDGAWHMEVTAWWADMRRQNELWIPGDRVLRFPGWALRHDPTTVAAQIRAALAAAGWRADP